MATPRITQVIDELPPWNKAVLFLGILVGVGYLFYGRDGALQFALPFPQTSITRR